MSQWRKLLCRSVHGKVELNRKQPAWRQPEGRDTGIRVYNCILRKKVPLMVKNDNYASWYTCGPTVYDSSHIGHASSYLKLDIIQRILREYFNVNLVTAMNITDIDDKIIAKSLETNMSWENLARQHEKEFWRDMQRLGVREPDVKIRVTENISRIVAFIQKIVDNNLAYVGKDKSVYFRVGSYAAYGKLQSLQADDTPHNFKESSLDFALWKAKKENEPSWPSPWGEGRPGWHIECSALASKLFGSTIDFHAGGLDLRFPHHENEEAQSCAFHNHDQWVNYWIHTGQLKVSGQADKMSKSLKNTISIAEMLEHYTSDQFRMACLLSNYRNSMDYCDEMMQSATGTTHKFIAFNADCRAYLEGKKTPQIVSADDILKALRNVSDSVDASLKEDFDTAKCVGHLAELTAVVSKEINRPNQDNDGNYGATLVDVIGAADHYVTKLFKIFGFQFVQDTNVCDTSFDLHGLLEEIVATRNSIRIRAMETKNKELFSVCDAIRDRLKEKGIEIKDHKKNSSWNFF